MLAVTQLAVTQKFALIVAGSLCVSSAFGPPPGPPQRVCKSSFAITDGPLPPSAQHALATHYSNYPDDDCSPLDGQSCIKLTVAFANSKKRLVAHGCGSLLDVTRSIYGSNQDPLENMEVSVCKNKTTSDIAVDVLVKGGSCHHAKAARAVSPKATTRRANLTTPAPGENSTALPQSIHADAADDRWDSGDDREDYPYPYYPYTGGLPGTLPPLYPYPTILPPITVVSAGSGNHLASTHCAGVVILVGLLLLLCKEYEA